VELKLKSCVRPPQNIYGPSLYIRAWTQKLDSPLITADTIKTTVVVPKLVEPLMNLGRTVWKDNFCNSPSLAKKLKVIYKT
jgi:hypothetical protein